MRHPTHSCLVTSAFVLLTRAVGCAAGGDLVAQTPLSSRVEIIEDIKNFEQKLNFEKTNNFKKHTGKEAHYRCYYTEKFELPSSYEDLRFEYGDKVSCGIDETKYDVFFYKIEALASGNAPVTTSLAEASLERLLVVVPHEDFHEDDRIQSLPTALAEASATLAGFLTASEFARQKYGEASSEYRRLSREGELFLRKAEIVNSYFTKLTDLYASLAAGNISTDQASEKKYQLFLEMHKACSAISPRPSSFNRFVSASNNAGLAFDRTYTKYYPLLYELHLSLGRDVNRTIEALQRGAGERSERKVLEYFRSVVRSANE